MKRTQILIIAAVFASGLSAGQLFGEKQPQMEAALKSLMEAKGHLDKATADKGGHRANAMKAIAEAIEQVKKGIAYDNKK